ncbi:MAG TPA: SMP-30/gluconolactonase/LRE family protein [Pyrinomonadaceae bacterium]|nr:SMP-30/gluconolactonase/LRE family protein [Pyrinomonadaceae bacterium]
MPAKNNLSLSVLVICALVLSFVINATAQSIDNYEPGPDSKVQPNAPKGEVLKFTFANSKIFPGTTRDYWIYVPVQYKPEKPACVLVTQDGIKYQSPIVLDNLIAKNEVPVIIGVFVTPGVMKAVDGTKALDRFNRSYEYDGLGDNYARFLLEELLPEVQTKKTSDGRAIRLSNEGNDRMIAGESSGAIAAFTAAWERPDAFSRVFSNIGTYVDLRGGMRYPTLIRKYEPKPIRIFMQDGSSDLNIYAGDWWMANQTMERALTFAGYEVNHVWGDGAHNGKHATAIFPDALRWLWKDWPNKVGKGSSQNQTQKDTLIPGEDWQLVSEGYQTTANSSVNEQGEVFFSDLAAKKIFKIGLDGKVTPYNAKSSNGQTIKITSRRNTKLVFDSKEKPSLVEPSDFEFNLVTSANGNTYFTDAGSDVASKVWLIRPKSQQLAVDSGLIHATGIAVSPDKTLLYVADQGSHWVYSYQIQPDGTLKNKQRYYWLHSLDSMDQSDARGMTVDRDGRLYVATPMGIQICDQVGRVQAIITTPNGKVTSLTFGGVNFDVLYALSGDKVYRRKLKVKGAPAWAEPIKPATPRL